ncbi:MAG: tetratricopeptide repeat protein [Candidatus Lokiarchaeota archaeon]|nr:tetratricopeptide repeat protein [Candidatus Lokiarchaeota archaeon]
MIEEEKRAIQSLHGILSDLLANNINIYGAAVAQPNGHLLTSKFQSKNQDLQSETQEIDKRKDLKTEDGQTETLEHSNEISTEGNSKEHQQESKESEKMSVDEGGIFMLAYSYGLLLEPIEKIGELLQKGKITTIFIKSTYTNLIIVPVTPLTNLLLIVPSGQAYDFTYFFDSKTINRNGEDLEKELEEDRIETIETIENDERIEEEIDTFFHNFKEELPGLLGTGHVGIKDYIHSNMLFGSFKEIHEIYIEKEKNDPKYSSDTDITGMLSYLFFIAEKLIHEDRHLELDLIQLHYEHGHVILKPIRNIAFVFDTEEPFKHAYVEQNLPEPQEFHNFLHQLENTSKDLINFHEKVNTRLESGCKLLKKKQPQDAMEYFAKAVEVKVDHAYTAKDWLNIGDALVEKAKYEEAAICYTQYHRDYPKDMESWKKQAKAYWYMDKEKQSIQCLKKALKLDNTDDKICFEIAELYYDLKKFRKAIHFYIKGLKLDSQSKEGWYNLAHSYFDLKRYKKAISCYKKVVEIDNDDSSAYIGIGWGLNKLRKYHKSIETFDIAISIDPDSSVAWNDKGCGFYRLKNYEEAMECYKKALDLEPRLKYPWGNIGVVNKLYGNYQIAVDYLEVAVKLDPKYAYYKRKLRRAKRKLHWARKKFLRKLTILSNSNPKLPISDVNTRLDAYIQPLLKKDTSLKDLLTYLIRSKQLKAKIAEDCIEFVKTQ